MRPDNVDFCLAISALFVTTAVATLRELRHGSFSVMFWIAIVAVYVASAAFDPFVSESLDWDYLRITVPDSVTVYTKAAVFAVLFNLGYLAARRYRYQFRGHELADDLKVPHARVLVTLMLLALLFYVSSVALPFGLVAAFSQSYKTIADVQISSLHMLGSYLLMIGAGAIFVTFKKQQWQLLSLLVVVTVLYYGLAQQRKHGVACLTPFAIVYLRHRFCWDRLLGSALFVLKVVVFIVVGSYALVFVQVLRYEGNFFQKGIPQLLRGQVAAKFADALHRGKSESPARWGYYYFMEPNVLIDGQFRGRTYRRLSLLPIPTSLIPSIKPRDYTETYYATVFDDEKADQNNTRPGTHHPLIYGDAYVNFGWPGTMLGIFWALMFNIVDWILKRSSSFVQLAWICPLGLSAMMLARGSVYNSVGSCYYTFLFVMAIAWLVGARRAQTDEEQLPGGSDEPSDEDGTESDMERIGAPPGFA
jgi:hypothetical protein